jgi:uncharacterized BrkB/YihY/UPF0761 family membrane protein
MGNTRSYPVSRLKPWQIILIFGILQCFIYRIGSFTLDYYAGGATKGFRTWPEVGGIGFFFLYVLSFFIIFVTVFPILTIKRFGVAIATYLPYAITGLFVEYYIEWTTLHSLVSPWAVVGWCVIGLAIGLSADLAYRYLPGRLLERWRAVITGVVMGLVNFLLVVVALTFFYVEQQSGPGSFLGIAYYGLPLLVINSGFGGCTAYAVSQ